MSEIGAGSGTMATHDGQDDPTARSRAWEVEPPAKEVQVTTLNESASVITDMQTVQYEMYNSMYPSPSDLVQAMDNSNSHDKVIEGLEHDNQPKQSITTPASLGSDDIKSVKDETRAVREAISGPRGASVARTGIEELDDCDGRKPSALSVAKADIKAQREIGDATDRKPGAFSAQVGKEDYKELSGRAIASAKAGLPASEDDIKADARQSIKFASGVTDDKKILKQDDQVAEESAQRRSPSPQIPSTGAGGSTFARMFAVQINGVPTVNAAQPGDVSRRESEGIPGAYDVPGSSLGFMHPQGNVGDSNSLQEPTGTSPLTRESDRSGALTAESSSTSTEGLVVADEVKTPDLPRAEGFDLEAAKREEQEAAERKEMAKKQQQRSIFMAIFCLILLVVGVVLGLLLSDNEREIDQQQNTSASTPLVPSTLAPTSYEGYLTSLLPDETLLSMEDPHSAQSRAFEWLVEDLDQNPHQPEHQIKQRFALASFYYATGGDKWVANDRWLDHNAHECEWFQKESFASKHTVAHLYPGYLAEFFPPTEPSPPRCDARGLYLTLWLDTNHLAGSLPLELYMLTSLETLSLTWNADLRGPLSSDIGKLTSLEGFFSYGLKNAGTIPSEIGLLTNLRGIGLYENEQVGKIPDEFWQLTNLETIILGRAPISGTFPSVIGTFSNLRWMNWMESGMSGPIPTEVGLLSKLVWFNLEQQGLTGPIPSELGLLPKLSLLSLWDNKLTGSIPTEFGLLTSSTLLTVVKNELIGTIPTQLGLLTALEELLDLGNPGLSGTVPSQLGLLSNLEELSLRDSILSGPIPSQLGLLTHLEWLGLQNNQFTGTFPEELSVLSATAYLVDLRGNPFLTGTIPSALCVLNNTCPQSAIKHCEADQGTLFECSHSLCGCACSTCSEGSHQTTLEIIPQH